MLLETEIEKLIGGAYYNYEYVLACERARDVKQLIDPYYFLPLIKKRNPNEDESIYEYRLANVRMYTETHFNKVLSSLQKIGTAQDYTITWPPVPASIKTEDSLQNYCERIGVSYKNFDDWLFGEALRYLLIDPNAVLIWIDQTYLSGAYKTNERLNPRPLIFEANDVLSYVEGEHALVGFTDFTKRGEWVRWYADNSLWYHSRKYYKYWYIDRNIIRVYTFNRAGDLEFEELPNPTGILFAIRLGGLPFSPYFPNVFKSLISGVVPYWQEALVQYSDFQGAIKNHVFPEKHEYLQEDCDQCSGTGVLYYGNISSTCNRCNGVGVVKALSPFGVVQIRPQTASEMQPAPFPAAAYVQKDIESVRLLKEVIESNINNGYRAIHFDHLATVPANQSGVAKAFDRSELNSFYYQIARHLLNNIARPSYFFIAMWRYYPTVQNLNTILEEYLPKIHIPQSFDIQSVDGLINFINSVKTSNVDISTAQELEKELVRKQFKHDQKLINLALDRIDLNPFFGRTAAELEIIKANGMSDERDIIISINIDTFVRKAYESDPDFFSKSYVEKRQVLLAYAEEILGMNDIASVDADAAEISETNIEGQ